MGSLRFSAPLVARGPAAAVVLDDEQVAAVGEGAKRFPVLATVGAHTWQTTATRMRGEYLLGLSRAVREAAGVVVGDVVEVSLELETAPREVELPAALEEALDGDPRARAGFDALAPSHRKEYARWISEAAREETRERRVAKAVELLREGRART